jgi:hypothetical protein
MASKIGLSYRRDVAQQRLVTVTEELSARVGIDVGAIPMQDRDPAALAVRQIEAVADMLECVLGEWPEEPVASTEDGESEATRPRTRPRKGRKRKES